MKLPIVLALLSISSAAAAQQAGTLIDPAPAASESASTRDSGPEMLSSPRGFVKHSDWYLAPTFGATQIDDQVTSLFGVRGAWRLNKTLGIGFAASGMELGEVTGSDRGVDIGYGGLLLEYVFKSDRLVHGVFDLTLGGGALCPNENRRFDCDDVNEFFVAEPTANLELNIAPFMRAALGSGYRLAISSTEDGMGTRELSGFVGRASLEFGNF